MTWSFVASFLPATAGATLAIVLVLWLIAIAIRDVSIIDMAFAALTALLLWIAWLIAGTEGQVVTLLLVLCSIWAIRLTWYLVARNWGHGEDVRYTKLRKRTGEGWPFHWYSLRNVFLMQGLVVWLLTMPQQLALAHGDGVSAGILAWSGVALWILGFVFEALGDEQLRRFKANPENRGKVLDTGLWRYTRHPNYFGELCQWWALFLIAATVPAAWWGLPGMLLYTFIVTRVTGQQLLDRKLSREKPDYAHYMQTTSGLIPRPPRAMPSE